MNKYLKPEQIAEFEHNGVLIIRDFYDKDDIDAVHRGIYNVIGQVMRIKNVPFIVVGELIPKGNSVVGTDQDDVVLVPYSSAMKRLFGATRAPGRCRRLFGTFASS